MRYPAPPFPQKGQALLELIAACALFAGQAFAADATCEAKAVDKNGKPLAGAAKSSFVKKCQADGADPEQTASVRFLHTASARIGHLPAAKNTSCSAYAIPSAEANGRSAAPRR